MTSRRHLLHRLGLPALILLGLPLLALLFINLSWFDQDLNDGIARLSVPGHSDSVPNNAMVAILGLSAASDRDPVQVGTSLVDWARDQRNSNGATSANHPRIDDLLGGTNPDQRWLDQYPAVSCNARSQLNCLARLQQQIGETPINNDRLALMLDRYRGIRKSRHFSETLVPQSGVLPLPDYGRLLQLARMNVAVYLKAEGPESALAELAADRAFWHTMLRDSESMITKMVAVAGLWNQLQFVSEIVAAEPLSQENLALANQIVRPLTDQAQDLSSAFAAEQRNLPATLDQLQSQAGPMQRLLLAVSTQPNATQNRYYEQITQPMMQLAKASPSQFRQRVGQGLAADFDYRFFPPGLYNLGGALLLQAFQSHQAWDYIGRIHDLQGMLSLVRLQIEIEQAQNREAVPIDDQIIQRLIDASDSRDPYVGDAMDWHRGNATLSFDCFGESLCQISM